MRVIKKFICIVLAIGLVSCINNSAEKPVDGTDTNTVVTTTYFDPAAPEDGGITVEDTKPGEILNYFSEIAFGSEYGDAPERLCRWDDTIVYKITGEPTKDDTDLIGMLCDNLNKIPHFPGIHEAKPGEKANFEIMFVTREEIQKQFSHASEACIGMSEYRWLTETGVIVSARAAIDIAETEERASTVCEEFLQAMGLAKDSYSHFNSVFYQGKCLYSWPSKLDWAMVELLYRPELKPKMSKYEAITAAAGILKW